MTNILKLSVSILLLFTISCKTLEPVVDVVKSSQKEITALTLGNISGATSTFDASTNTYIFSVPSGTNVKALALTFTLPNGATSSPASGSIQDFTNPVSYTITAEDGTKQVIKVVVNVQTAPKSSEKQILEFSFNALSPVVKANIDQTSRKITAVVPASTDLTKLIPSIILSPKATISPASGLVQNFSNTTVYEVTAEDGSKVKYEVIVSKISNSADLPDFDGLVLKQINIDNNTLSAEGYGKEKYSIFIEYKNKHINKIIAPTYDYISDYKYLFYYSDFLSIQGETNSEWFRYYYQNNRINKMLYFGNLAEIEFTNNRISKIFSTVPVGEKILEYAYDERNNLKKIDFNRFGKLFTYSMTYDDKENAFGSTSDDFFSIIFNNYMIFDETPDSFKPYFIAPNKNNLTSFSIKNNLGVELRLDFKNYKYNSKSYPTEVLVELKIDGKTLGSYRMAFEYF